MNLSGESTPDSAPGFENAIRLRCGCPLLRASAAASALRYSQSFSALEIG